MNNHELVQIIQRMEQERQEIENSVNRALACLRDAREKSMKESTERRARLNVLLAKAGRPTLPIITKEEK